MNDTTTEETTSKDTSSADQKPQDAVFKEAPGLFARGICMGAADIIPGVSGGTMALILGIYTRLVDAIKSVDLGVLKEILRFRLKDALGRVHWRFLIALLCGIAAGMVVCGKIIKIQLLLQTHPEPIYGLFFGLIVSSIILLARDSGFPKAGGCASYLIGGILGYVVVTSVPASTPDAPWFVFLCGMVAICAMILPGISGSYILLLLKKYEYVLNGVFQVNNQSFGTNCVEIIFPFAIGAILGITLFSRLLSWVLHRWERKTMMAMNGLLIVSLYVIFPFQHRETIVVRGKEKLLNLGARVPEPEELTTPNGLLAIGLAITGLIVVLVMDRLARKKSGSGPEAGIQDQGSST